MNPVLALILANLVWGAASPVFKLALQNIPPFTLAFFRFFAGSLVFVFLALRHWQKLERKDWIQILIGGFFAININIGFFFMGLQKTESINAPIIASSQPIFLYLFSILVLRERPHPRVFLGILISFLGVLGIILSPLFTDGGISAAAKETAIEGNLFLIIATLGSVIYTLIFKNVLKRINFFQVTFISFFFCSLLFLPLIPKELSNWSFASLDGRGILGLVFGIFLSSALAYALYNYGVSKLPAQEVGVFTYIDPVVAVLLAIPLVHEYPTVYFFAGTFLVFIGIFIAEGRVHYHPFHRLKRPVEKAV